MAAAVEMSYPLRRFPMILTMAIVIATLVFICLVEVPITIYTSTNLTFFEKEHGENVAKNGSRILMVYAAWYAMFLFWVVHRCIKNMHKQFKERNTEAFERCVREFIILCFIPPSILVCFPILRPYSEDMDRFLWFNIRMTCYGILSVPLISWYFDSMDLYAEVESIHIVDAVEAQ